MTEEEMFLLEARIAEAATESDAAAEKFYALIEARLKCIEEILSMLAEVVGGAK